MYYFLLHREHKKANIIILLTRKEKVVAINNFPGDIFLKIVAGGGLE